VRFETRTQVVVVAPHCEQLARAVQLREAVLEDRDDQGILRTEVVVHRRVVSRPGLGRDLPQRHTIDSVQGEQPLGREHDPQRARGFPERRSRCHGR